jgi:hypothetical protein
MKVIIFNDIENFEAFEKRLHEAMKQIDGYNAHRWATPFYSVDKTKVACIIEADGIRGEICLQVANNKQITDISRDNEFWFEKKEL